MYVFYCACVFIRHLASGELLALTLSLEDLVLANEADLKRMNNSTDEPRNTLMVQQPLFNLASLPVVEVDKQHSSLTCPILVYNLINKFLVLSLQVEKLRYVWACTVTNATSVKTYREAKHFHNVFRQKVVKIAKKAGIKQDYDGSQRYHIQEVCTIYMYTCMWFLTAFLILHVYNELSMLYFCEIKKKCEI